jgi:hypothetical protein
MIALGRRGERGPNGDGALPQRNTLLQQYLAQLAMLVRYTR